jgi:hypothetical protein
MAVKNNHKTSSRHLLPDCQHEEVIRFVPGFLPCSICPYSQELAAATSSGISFGLDDVYLHRGN